MKLIMNAYVRANELNVVRFIITLLKFPLSLFVD